MKIVEVERLLASHLRLILALEAYMLDNPNRPPYPATNKEARAALEGARMVREEIGRP